MTSHPIPANAGHWWLVCGKWRRLHAIPGGSLTVEAMRDAIDQGEPVGARAACRIRRRWDMPGMFSRLGAPRCAACCAALGTSTGHGTPANDVPPRPTTDAEFAALPVLNLADFHAQEQQP